MKVVLESSQIGNALPTPWPSEWSIPRVGDVIETADQNQYTVAEVFWYPEGDPDEGGEPFVVVHLDLLGAVE